MGIAWDLTIKNLKKCHCIQEREVTVYCNGITVESLNNAHVGGRNLVLVLFLCREVVPSQRLTRATPLNPEVDFFFCTAYIHLGHAICPLSRV